MKEERVNREMSDKIILASASRARADLLRSAGIQFGIEPAEIDEEYLRTNMVSEKANVKTITCSLAEAKALDVSKRYASQFTVVGVDLILVLKKKLSAKPKQRRKHV